MTDLLLSCAQPLSVGARDRDRNGLGHDRRIVRDVIGIPEQELQGVLTRGQRDRCFRLPRPEMLVVEVIGDWLIERRELGVDQEVMVTGIGLVQAGRGHAHILKAKVQRNLRRNGSPVLDAYEINTGVGRRGPALGGMEHGYFDGPRHVPVNADIGSIDVIFVDEKDEEINELGIKGVGEIGIVGTAAAVANAVYHATGKRVRDLPITIDKLLRD